MQILEHLAAEDFDDFIASVTVALKSVPRRDAKCKESNMGKSLQLQLQLQLRRRPLAQALASLPSAQ